MEYLLSTELASMPAPQMCSVTPPLSGARTAAYPARNALGGRGAALCAPVSLPIQFDILIAFTPTLPTKCLFR